MLQIAPGVRVYLACRPVDMRRGFDGLSADVAQVLKADPFSGAVFAWQARRLSEDLDLGRFGALSVRQAARERQVRVASDRRWFFEADARATRTSRRGDRLASHSRSRSIGTALICLISC